MLSHTVETRREGWFAWEGPEYNTVISSRVRLARNLTTFPFTHRLTGAQRLELRRTVEEVLQQIEQEYAVVDAATLHDRTRRFFEGRGLLSAEDGLTFLSLDERIALRLAMTDHLRIHGFAGGLDLGTATASARSLDHELEKKLDYAVSMRLGYLSPMVDRVGTGLSASVMMHVPALAHSEEREAIGDQLVGPESDRITVRRFGTGEQSAASLHVFSCYATLGETEEETLAVLERFVRRLLHYEQAARDQLHAHHGEDLIEAASRAYGTLLHARRLGVEEALELLSVVRMAAVDGKINEVEARDSTRLLFLVQDSQVAALEDDDAAPIEERRARLVRSVLTKSKSTDN